MFLSLPVLADPPAESPSTRKSSFLLASLPAAFVSFPFNILSFPVFDFPFLASSRAFLAASLATLLFSALSRINVDTVLFSSKKYDNFSYTMLSTTLLACGVPSFPFVCPSNCSSASGMLTLITAVKPSLVSEPSNTVFFPFSKLLFFTY